MTRYMNILWVQQLQKILDTANIPITALALHPGPGIAAQDGSTDSLLSWLGHSTKNAGSSSYKTSFTTLFAATSPTVRCQRDAYKGQYLEPFGRPTQSPIKDASDAERARLLWRATEEAKATVLSRSVGQ